MLERCEKHVIRTMTLITGYMKSFNYDHYLDACSNCFRIVYAKKRVPNFDDYKKIY